MARSLRDAALARHVRLARVVRDRLAEGWSSQQNSGWLKSAGERGLGVVAIEMIYALVFRARQTVEELWRILARRRKRQHPLRAALA
ncbi:MAG: hypothetical protein AAFR79_20980 [Pseudomonadota bacterium]